MGTHFTADRFLKGVEIAFQLYTFAGMFDHTNESNEYKRTFTTFSYAIKDAIGSDRKLYHTHQNFTAF
jgi:hypothetical protein